ncbi:MAG TPA: 4-(cytidine 5'-diphospho)-2-C-methyl-D-erythritol kinase [Firmicutes bacterium]|nr:4-(cytidine 5'-diphospho)-2-C-methyl-D-erythritol kinase [Bacillota bacterium]
MADKLVLPAYAKINLALDVLGRRPDGYHEVEMVMQTIALHDRVVLTRRGKGELLFHCSDPGLPREENLAYRAALLLQQECGVGEGAAIFLEKRIPVAAGLAGGSTDAAAVLRGLNRLWALGLSEAELQLLGKRLGADVPYCIQGGTCLARGIGEILTPLPPLPPTWLVLAKPPGGLATGEVYRQLDLTRLQYRPRLQALIAALAAGSLAGVAASMGNVLQGVSEGLVPEIAPLRQALVDLGALGSLMTGSGPTVFGLVEEEKKARAIAKKLRQEFPAAVIMITKAITPAYTY